MTTPTPTTTWSVNRRAAQAVVLNAQDNDDARLLLDMLGLVDGPQGREVLPDDTRHLDIGLHHSAPGREQRDDAEPLSSQTGRANTVPAGLARTTEPVVVAEPKPSPAAAPAADDDPPAPAPKKRKGKELGPVQHGKPGGLRAHHRRGETVPDDDPCGCIAAHKAAQAEYQRRHYAKKYGQLLVVEQAPEQTDEPRPAPSPLHVPAKVPPAPKPIAHGSVAGYLEHYARGALPACEPCTTAAAPAPTSEPGPDDWQSLRAAASVAADALQQLLDVLHGLAQTEAPSEVSAQ